MTINDDIKAQVRTLMNSDYFHLLILEGRPGLGKTTSVVRALEDLGIQPAILGSYSTPLGLFNFLQEHPTGITLLDDTSSVLTNPQSMAILKAATWDIPGRGRYIRWTSKTEQAHAIDFVYEGKVILICNLFPNSSDGDAVRNRSLDLNIDPSLEETKELLKEAAKDKLRFPNQGIASQILRTLLENLNQGNLHKVSYRTLQKAYEVAVHNPGAIPRPLIVGTNERPEAATPHKVISRLHKSGAKVKDQLKEFERLTGFKRRSFFKYRKQIGIAETDADEE